MNEVSLTPDTIELEAELTVEMRQYPVIPNPEGTPTADISTMGIDSVIYAVKDETARTELENKVDKETGKELSTNDFTNALKSKLDGIQNGAEVNVQSDFAQNDNTKDDFIKNKPTKLSDFDNDEGFIDKSVNNLENYYTKSDTYTKSEVNSALDNKVDKVEGKGLSENDFTDTDKTKLDGIEAEANKTVVDNSVTATSTNPVESKAIYNLLNDLLPEAEATGNPISITNASGLNAKSLKVELEPIQDLNGYDSPWVGGGGKNKLQLTVDGIKSLNSGTWSGNTITTNGVEFTIITENNNVVGVKVKRVSTTTTQTLFRVITNANGELSAVDGLSVILNGCPSGISNAYLQFVSYDGTNNANDFGNGTSAVTTDLTANTTIRIVVYANFEGEYTFRPMIRLSTEADGTFVPYSNICPISGRTQTTIKRTGLNIWDEQWEQGGIYTTNGETFASNTRIRSKNFNECFPNTVYYFKSTNQYRVFCYDKNHNYITYITNLRNTTFTTPSNAYYFKLASISDETTYNNDICVNISNASVNDTYESYKGETDTTIQFGQTVYGGEVDVTSGGTSDEWGNITFDGSDDEVWVASTNRFNIIISDANFETSRTEVYCNIGHFNSTGSEEGVVFGILSGDNNRLYYYPPASITTTSQFKTWLSTNNLQVVYPKTPTTINTPENEISLLKGNNTLTADGDMELKYSKTPQ